ncbi:MAG: hypothetical protein KAI40_06190 [Desulfobacterales bacterium]|nr:hypothetical protein [Desulfobacterales bacterium]
MTTSNLFSKKQKKLRGDSPDVYTYDNIPNALRVQIIHLWDDALGTRSEYDNILLPVQKVYRLIVGTLCREYGMFTLASSFRDESRDFRYELQAFFLGETDTEKLIDVIESSFRAIDRMTRKYSYKETKNFDEIADEAIKELNKRFKEHAIGYKFEDGIITRIDSELIHSEVVKPALRVLSDNHFKEAQKEFITAHDHYQKENHKEALNESLKAFESTMKAICNKNGWEHDSKATSKDLIKICLDKTLIPLFWQPQIHALASMLENGMPTGTAYIIVPDHVVAYVLHMTASAIVFLGESDKAIDT